MNPTKDLHAALTLQHAVIPSHPSYAGRLISICEGGNLDAVADLEPSNQSLFAHLSCCLGRRNTVTTLL